MREIVYHKVPDELQGDTIYPLNRLKDIFPGVYQKQAAKYTGRENLLQRKVPILNCLWNDVIHLTAINPKIIFSYLRQIGFEYPLHGFYEIDFSKLDPDYCIEMIYSGGERKYRKIESDNFPKVENLPAETIEYFKNCWKEKTHPLLFKGIPHILYKGAINIKGTAIIEV
ncbi:MAG: hypothetical protein RDU76_00495 [Candidatus Edwardsbacteria bacterium]|nr:hypothetical protein [Candidatus Edwardsbacteria bacterium]